MSEVELDELYNAVENLGARIRELEESIDKLLKKVDMLKEGSECGEDI